MNGEGIAIVGMACRYPDADDPAQLWQSVLERRQAFRRLPAERLNLDDYLDHDHAAADKTYGTKAAVLEGWRFDRAAFRIPGPAYRAADPAHWLALETASRALDDAGYPGGQGLNRDRVAVVIGNSLTGEVTRAATLRLRWPYVRRVLAAAAVEAGLTEAQCRALTEGAEKRYLAPFPPVGDETLAGGLANTIAGRICNYFDFHGGGYTVDGACASSLLSVITACRTLRDGSADVVLAGGVDISLDPFELVGFAKTSALTADRMWIYDERSAGFIPGEGCGVVTLMRAGDARAAGLTVRAELVGWGVSSDGRGGITRPERQGQLLALRRAYELAGVDPSTVRLIEGHGTGTAVGDATELAALLELRDGAAEPAALGSIKANIGHTKAASGVAGLIKATMSLATGVLPPTTGCDIPHPSLRAPDASLRVLAEPAPWPDGPRLAGVSSMGFGGINAHVVVHAPKPEPLGSPPVLERPPARIEVIALSGHDVAEIRAVLDRLAVLAPRLSEAELHDLACHFGRLAPVGRVRAAIVAGTPEQLAERSAFASARLAELRPGRLFASGGTFMGDAVAGRVTVLLPGQGAPVRSDLGALGRYLGTTEPPAGEGTAVAQPAIYRATTAALRWLAGLGVSPRAGIGHSLGEIAGLVWAGCLAAEDGDHLVIARGQVMSMFGLAGTGMVSVAADSDTAETLCAGTGLVVAAYNGPRSQVLAGPQADIVAVAEQADRRGIPVVVLPVSHAFHSPAMADCVNEFKSCLQAVSFLPPAGRLVSTVLGRTVTEGDDPAELLSEQLTAPVRFWDAVTEVLPDTDLFCEAGPGNTLSALIGQQSDTPVVSMDSGSKDDRGVAETAAALFAAGAAPALGTLFADRAARPIDIWRDRVFLANPCSSPPVPEEEQAREESARPGTDEVEAVVRALLAEATELDAALIDPQARLLGDLHLTSLGATQLAVSAAEAAGRERPIAPLITGDTSVAELTVAIETLPPAGAEPGSPAVPGIKPWIRCFGEELRRSFTEVPEAYGGCPRAFVVPGHPLSEAAASSFHFGQDREPGAGALVYIPDPAAPEAVRTLLDAAGAAVRWGTLVAVTHGSALSGFLGALRQEHPEVGVTLLRVPATADGVRSAVRYATAEPGCWRELVIDTSGAVSEPIARPLWREADGEPPVGSEDVLLVSGGGKGIGYECAAALARTRGVTLALLGRGRPERDERLRTNLEALRAAGVRFAYEAVDVTDAREVESGVRRLTDRLGTITALLHASGVNEPVRFAELTEKQAQAHLAPKVSGLRNLLAALDPARLRMLVTFGSVIGRYGLSGEGHYALANGVLRAEVERLAAKLPGCRVLNLDWSVWTGTGMGEQLGVLDTLRHLDVHPIPVAEGLDVFLRLLATPGLPATVAVHGRLGPLGQADGAQPASGLLERIPLHYRGVELVAETDLDVERHPYLTGHRLDGIAVVPAVVGMEMMAQAATALAGRPLRHLADLALERPIIVPDNGSRTVRVCALREEDTIEVVLRSDETAYRVDHFRARFPLALPVELGTLPNLPEEDVPLESEDLYGPLYFHTGPFELVAGFSALGAKHARVHVRARETDGDYPLICDAPLLGDAIGNDATVHALQACVPHRRLLPVGCERFTRIPGTHNPREICATERYSADGEYVWDVVARDRFGKRAITWTGLRLRDVGPIARTRPWPARLLAIYLERSAIALGLHHSLRMGVTSGDRCTAGGPRRHDGDADLVLRAQADGGAVCHGEPVDSRTESEWRRMLGDGFGPLLDRMRTQLAEPFPTVAARVWATIECLTAIGYPPGDPVVLDGVYDGGWAVLRAGKMLIASVTVSIVDIGAPVAIAVVTAAERDVREDA